jgi:hypothetical protein
MNDKEQGFAVLLNKDIINDPHKIINRRGIYFKTVSKKLCDKIKKS